MNGDGNDAVDIGPVRRVGRPPALNAEHLQVLRELARQQPAASLDVITRQLAERCGVRVCSLTVRRALKVAGIVRFKPARRAVSAERAAPPRRYGYTAAHRREAIGRDYSCCLTDAEWALVADLFERAPGGQGAPARLDRRVLVEACCYVLRTGCAWRLLPRTFPAWTTVYKTFARWAALGLFEAMHDRLRAQWRARLGRHAQPTAAVLDAQSNRSSPQGGDSGFDTAKKVKGRKRHLLVDTLGLVLAVTVAAVGVQDHDGAADVVALGCTKMPALQRLYVDGAYSGQCAQALHEAHKIDVEVVRHPGHGNQYVFHDTAEAVKAAVSVPSGFVVLPKRWVVKRTHAWNGRWRRLIVHYDRSSVAWVWLAQARILAARLAATG